jgi:hypothetical protein
MENENLEPIGEIKMAPAQKLEQCEWVFQFDDDEPQIFAWTSEDSPDEEPTVTLTINNTKDAYISFTNRNSGFTLCFKTHDWQLEGRPSLRVTKFLSDSSFYSLIT